MNNPQLAELAKHAYNGACNPLALINSLPRAIEGMSQDEARNSVELKIVIGQLSYLLGESLGASSEAISQYATQVDFIG
jgi:hypothetical protein